VRKNRRVRALRIGFLGDIEEPESGHDINMTAAAGLRGVDVLVTHNGPYGLGNMARQDPRLGKVGTVDRRASPAAPRARPLPPSQRSRRYGPTTSYGLAQLVPPLDHNPNQEIGKGSVDILDTTTLVFDYVPAERTAEVKVSSGN